MIHITEDKLKAAIQICLGGDMIYTEEREAKLVHDIKALSIADVSHSKVEKPPLGLKPKWLHDQHRQGEILAAISRYLELGKTPPKEWAIEFASYCG